jgi:hypothetical protein
MVIKYYCAYALALARRPPALGLDPRRKMALREAGGRRASASAKRNNPL